MLTKIAIGIDLGSSKCCVGVVRDGKVEIIENERGNKTTPSYVAFTDTERLIGEDAKDQATLNPTNTVFGVKRIMGRKGDDPIVAACSKDLPYLISSGNCNKARIHVTYKNHKKEFIPEQISAMLLTKMKEMAETHLGCEVHDAVISVPACFTNAQRQATKDAAQIAGLNVLRLINEPTAAAIAYEANRRTDAAETVVVVDFGGGKLDVSVMKVKKCQIIIRTVQGCTHYGGIDIDKEILDHFVSMFSQEHKIDLNQNKKALGKLRVACEKLKRSLSLLPEAQTLVDGIVPGVDFQMKVTKKKFEDIFLKELRKTLLGAINRALKDARIYTNQVQRVVLVGGSSRIRSFTDILLEKFTQHQIDRTVNPDEAVAYGAAIQASFLCVKQARNHINIFDVYPRQTYVQSADGQDSDLIFRKYTRIPTEVAYLETENWSYHKVYEVCEEQFSLGEDIPQGPMFGFVLGDLFGAQTRSSLIKLCCSIDADGIFEATLVLDRQRVYEGLMTDYMRSFSANDIVEMIYEEGIFKEDAVEEKKRILALTDLEYDCYKLREGITRLRGQVTECLLRRVSEKCDEILFWIDSTPSATKSECDSKKKYLNSLCKSKLQFKSSLRQMSGAPSFPAQKGSTNSKNLQTPDVVCGTKKNTDSHGIKSTKTDAFSEIEGTRLTSGGKKRRSSKSFRFGHVDLYSFLKKRSSIRQFLTECPPQGPELHALCSIPQLAVYCR